MKIISRVYGGLHEPCVRIQSEAFNHPSIYEPGVGCSSAADRSSVPPQVISEVKQKPEINKHSSKQTDWKVVTHRGA